MKKPPSTLTCPSCGGLGWLRQPAALRAKRVGAKLTLRQFAFNMKVSPTYISDIERGNRGCPLDIRKEYEKL